MKITLKSARVNAGYTLVEVAKALHLSKEALCGWESNRHFPKITTVLQLCDFYGCNITDIDFSDMVEEVQKLKIKH